MFDFLKDPKTSVRLAVVAPDGKDEAPLARFYPGETVHARVTLASERAVKIQQARIALVCQEHYEFRAAGYKGSTSTYSATNERHADRRVFLGETSLPAGFQQTYEFKLPIPSYALPSAEADIATIKWILMVALDREMATDIEDALELRVLSCLSRASARAFKAGVSSEPDEAVLTFSLPGKELVMGETLGGSLLIIPKKEFDVSEIRVELCRRTRVPRDRGNECNKAITFTLSEKTHLVSGQSYSFPLEIGIPTSIPPTFITPNSKLDWTLKGILARSLRMDTVVEVPIKIFGGR